MNHRIAILALALLAGCGGGAPLVTTLSGPSPLPAPDAFSCLRDQLKTTGFTQTSYDPSATCVSPPARSTRRPAGPTSSSAA